MRCYYCAVVLALLAFSSLMISCGPKEGPSPMKSPEDELASFDIAPGISMDLVASEPMVQDPVVMTFDEDGRLWVVEMKGFNMDVEGAGEDERNGSIAVLEDTDSDGVMDKRTVFMDSLMLPRSVAIVKGGVLVAERYPLWYVQDLDGDLVADKKTLVDSTYGGNGMAEHSPNGLWRGIDNWYYNAKSTARYRMIDGEWIKDSTEFRGQWGISHDNYGRLYYNYNWSQLHADLVPPNYFSRNPNHKTTTGLDHGLTIDRKVFPIRTNPAVNRGYIDGTLSEEGKLLEFTSACSPFVYRGDAFGEEYQGDVFVAEPSGNLVKQNDVDYSGFLISAQSTYPDHEVLASTDERFRPVSFATGPDGALYIADMYRGLIQHAIYMTPYLKEVTLERDLVYPIHLGRIWRMVPEGWQGRTPYTLSDSSNTFLVGLLSHPNGFYRDVAQRLLIDREAIEIKGELIDLLHNGDNDLGRLHALWTLEGFDAVDEQIGFMALHDTHPQVRVAALRVLEDILDTQTGVEDKLSDWIASVGIEDAEEVVLQAALTLGHMTGEDIQELLLDIADQYGDRPVMRDAILSSATDIEQQLLERELDQYADSEPTNEIFLEMLSRAVASKGDPAEVSWALNRMDSDTPEWQRRAVLTGLAMQMNDRMEPMQLSSEPGIMRQMDALDELSRIRLQTLSQKLEWPGHKVEIGATAREQQLTEEEKAQFAQGRQHYLSACAVCHGNDGTGLPRFAPPLLGSEWVLGDEKRLALLLLHGLEGPIEVRGKLYKAPEILPVMPSHSILDDRDIAAIMTYIRNEWGHSAGAVSGRSVSRIRVTSQGRVQPWSVEDLNQHVAENPLTD